MSDYSHINTLVFDLDDTLLRRDKTLLPENREVLTTCINSGYSIIFATSRPQRAVQAFVDRELLKQCSVITLNGSVYSENGSLHIEGKLPYAQKIVSHLEHYANLIISIESDGLIVCSVDELFDKEFYEYHLRNRNETITVEQVDWQSVSKIAVDGMGENIVHVIDSLADFYVELIPCHNDTFCNIVPKGIDKATTLEILLQQLGRSYDTVMSFGNDIPDIEMMKRSAISVAMGNGTDEVKTCANYIIGDCDSNTITEFISEELL